jgi:hypothetical protein
MLKAAVANRRGFKTDPVFGPYDINRPVHARATDQEIKKWVLSNHGFVPESAWIDYCKQLFGGSPPGSNQRNDNPCPPEKVPALKQAFREFGLSEK